MPTHGTTIPDEAGSEIIKKRHDSKLRSIFHKSPIYKGNYLVDQTEDASSYPLYTALLNNNIKGGDFSASAANVITTEGDNAIIASEQVDQDLDTAVFDRDTTHPNTEAEVYWGFTSHTDTTLDYKITALDPVGTNPGGTDENPAASAPHFAFAPNLLPPVSDSKIPFEATDDNPTSVRPDYPETQKAPLQPHQTVNRVSRANKPLRYEGVRISPLPNGLELSPLPEA